MEGLVNMKIYLDVYFILNFIMNYFLMCITGIFRQKKAHPYWWGIVSGVCSACSTGIYAWSCMSGAEILRLDLLVFPVMVAAAYRARSWSVWLRDMVSYMMAALLTGGCLYALFFGITAWQGSVYQMTEGRQTCSVRLVLSGVLLLSVVFLLLAGEMLHQVQFQKNTGEAMLIHRGKRLQVHILYDSGNQLISPYTGERVAVISKSLAESLKIADGQHPVYIPYQSVGGGGILPAYRIECLEWSSRNRMENLLAAVSDQIGQQEIQMILNIT